MTRPPVRRLLWIAGIAVGVLALYALGGFYGVPRLTRHFLLGYFDSIHRPAQVGAIHFNPFTVALDVEDFSVPDPDGSLLIAFRSLHVQFGASASLIRRGYVFSVI